MVNAVSSAKMNAGPIDRTVALHKLAPWMLAAGWLLAGCVTTPPLAGQETNTSPGVRAVDWGNRPRAAAARGAASNAASGVFTTGNNISYNDDQILLGKTKV